MIRIMLVLFAMIATTLMGIGIVIALTAGLDTTRPILIASAAGFLLAIPVSWAVARQIVSRREA